jgi:2-haloacid dehalogenase
MIRTVVFDLGGVLFDWNPRHLFRKLIADDAMMEEFLTTVVTREWHEKQDSGYSCVAATRELQARFPQHTALIEAFYGRFDEMIGGTVLGTVELLRALHGRGVALYGLSNWPSDTFHVTSKYDFMSCFRGIVVSGHEGVMKPDPGIFHILLRRYSIDPTATLFIDDVAKNVRAGEAMGLTGHIFTTAEALRQDLVTKGLLL